MQPDPVLECQDCGKVLRHLSPGEAQKVADNPYNFIAYCAMCTQLRENYMEGLCAGCFTMRSICIGETRCDTCRSIGGSREFDPEPYPKKSGPSARG